MSRAIVIFIIQLFTATLFAQQPALKVPAMNFDQFEPYLHKQTDTLYLINFWATWCSPCREELPFIEAVREKYGPQKFKVILVSLDFPNQLESRLKPFIVKNKLKSEVILLDDPNQNRWIDKVDPKWSGDIPFTLIYKKNIRDTYSQSFTYNQLDSIIHLKINQPWTNIFYF